MPHVARRRHAGDGIGRPHGRGSHGPAEEVQELGLRAAARLGLDLGAEDPGLADHRVHRLEAGVGTLDRPLPVSRRHRWRERGPTCAPARRCMIMRPMNCSTAWDRTGLARWPEVGSRQAPRKRSRAGPSCRFDVLVRCDLGGSLPVKPASMLLQVVADVDDHVARLPVLARRLLGPAVAGAACTRASKSPMRVVLRSMTSWLMRERTPVRDATDSSGPGGGIGRHGGLKPPFPARGVWVRTPPRARSRRRTAVPVALAIGVGRKQHLLHVAGHQECAVTIRPGPEQVTAQVVRVHVDASQSLLTEQPRRHLAARRDAFDELGHQLGSRTPGRRR